VVKAAHDGADRYLDARPWLTRLVIAATALHLLNITPKRMDPLHITGLYRGDL
jgi:hypothetical protein